VVTIEKHYERIWDLIKEIPDPEIPVLTLTDLGIIKKVEIEEEKILVHITPTYIGCPAMKVFEDDIVSKLNENGFPDVSVKTILSPAWTTDWMTKEGKRKLMEYGISPPVGSADKTFLSETPKKISCPQCRSENTEMISAFGSTPCKSLYKCLDCLEPFDYFKCI